MSHVRTWSSWDVIIQSLDRFKFGLKFQATATRFKWKYRGKKLKVLMILVLDGSHKKLRVLASMRLERKQL